MNTLLAQKDAARLKEVIARADKTGITQFSLFLDPLSGQAFERLAAAQGLLVFRFGGYEEAQRAVYAAGFELVEQADFPIVPLKVTWDARYASITHPDVLGAVMGLGLLRERFGDIVLMGNTAYIFALEPTAKILLAQLTQVGSAPAHVQQADQVQIEREEGKLITASFQSLRLDAVIAEALHLSRTRAQELISRERVQLNYMPCLKSDARLAPGDVISVRGGGRIVLKELGGKSKKDRTYLTMEVFVRKGRG